MTITMKIRPRIPAFAFDHSATAHMMALMQQLEQEAAEQTRELGLPLAARFDVLAVINGQAGIVSTRTPPDEEKEEVLLSIPQYDTAISTAINTLAEAPTWEKTYQVLLQNQALLISDRSLALLNEIITIHRSLNESAEVDNWNQYLALLKDARIHGVQTAWDTFIHLVNDSAEAIEFFLGATKEEQRKYFFANANILLSNSAFVYLRSRVAMAQSNQDSELVAILEPVLQMLQDARIHPIVIAWKDWEHLL